MKLSVKVALTVLAVALPAMVLGPIIWPPADAGVEPTGMQVVLFVILAVGDALFLGLGMAFLIFGYPVLRRVSPESRVRAWAMFVSVGYLLVSWWPHLNMHAANGLDLGGLLVIDYVFHLPLQIAGAVLATAG